MTAISSGPNALKRFLTRAQAELCKGEKVKVPFTGSIHRMYVKYQMKGSYDDLFCTKTRNGFYLTRIR